MQIKLHVLQTSQFVSASIGYICVDSCFELSIPRLSIFTACRFYFDFFSSSFKSVMPSSTYLKCRAKKVSAVIHKTQGCETSKPLCFRVCISPNGNNRYSMPLASVSRMYLAFGVGELMGGGMTMVTRDGALN